MTEINIGAEQGPLWGCDLECGLGADTMKLVVRAIRSEAPAA
jgi:hypothetical protein